MARALIVFLAGATVVIGFGWFARAVLHLDCLGPYIEGWGCLSAPLPQELPGNSTLMFDLGVVVAGLVVSLIVKDLVWTLAGRVAGALFPGWARRAAAPPPSRGYPLR